MKKYTTNKGVKVKPPLNPAMAEALKKALEKKDNESKKTT